MNWPLTLEIMGLIGGATTLLAFLLAPSLYVVSKIDALRQEVRTDMAALNERMSGLNSRFDEIKEENKDFHGRLCTIEERTLKGDK